MRTEILDEIKKIKEIKVVDVGDYTGVRKTVRVLKTGNWYKKLVKKAIKSVYKDIKKTLKKDKEARLYLYSETKKNVKDNIIYVSIDLEYDIN